MTMRSKFIIAVLATATSVSALVSAQAMPIAAPSALEHAKTTAIEQVAWRGRGWGGWGPAFAAGAVVGGAIAATQPWYGYDYYGPGYGYTAPGYAYTAPDYEDYAYAPGPSYGGGSVASCEQRFRSYDPASGTYLGFDGRRHPCP